MIMTWMKMIVMESMLNGISFDRMMAGTGEKASTFEGDRESASAQSTGRINRRIPVEVVTVGFRTRRFSVLRQRGSGGEPLERCMTGDR